MQLPAKVPCNQCDGNLWLKPEGQWGPYYSHKLVTGGYHNAKVKDIFPDEHFTVDEYDSPVATKPATPNPDFAPKQAVDWDEKDRKIQRQHSQEMALRYLALMQTTEDKADTISLKEVTELTDHFMKDLE